MSRMLEKVPNNIDKREGSIIWIALAPAALELAEINFSLDVNMDKKLCRYGFPSFFNS